jgi:hypothetical protein
MRRPNGTTGLRQSAGVVLDADDGPGDVIGPADGLGVPADVPASARGHRRPDILEAPVALGLFDVEIERFDHVQTTSSTPRRAAFRAPF